MGHYLSCSRHSISTSHGASLLGTKSTSRHNNQVSIHFCSRKLHLLKVPNTSPLSISQAAAKNIKTGDCVLVQFKANKSFRQFVGLINNREQEALEIRFLRRNDSAGLVYILPVMEDKAWVTPDQVIKTFTPKVDNRGRYHFVEAVFAE